LHCQSLIGWQYGKAIRRCTPVVLYAVSQEYWNKFVTGAKKVAMEMLKSVTQFFKAQFTQNKLDGLLKLMELEHIKKMHTAQDKEGALQEDLHVQG
jgi:hypothetical protein